MRNKESATRVARRDRMIRIVAGIVIVFVSWFISSRTDLSSAERSLIATTSYIKEQCNRFVRIEMATETKSLIRVTESCNQVAYMLADNTSEEDGETLKEIADKVYVSGIVLLDKKGKITSQYHDAGSAPEGFPEMLASDVLLNSADHPEKRYAVRLHCSDGGEADVAAEARKDGNGVIVVYYYTTAEYKNAFSLSVAALLSGYRTDNDGTIVVCDGTLIVASNDESLIGKSADDVPILKKIKNAGETGKLHHAKSESSVFKDFGLMQRGRDFYVYGYLSERSVFHDSPRVLLYTSVAYLIVLAGIATIRWRTAQHYREEQMKRQKQYTESLWATNKQLSEAVERADRASAAKTSFLSRMSHDIRTPLNGIIGLLEIDSAHPDDIALAKANREKMQIAANYLLALINDVLQMSKLESGEINLSHEVVDLGALLKDVAAIVEQRAAESGVTLILNKGGDRFETNFVYGSPLHLRQIFLNIYANCIKYNKAGGSVSTQIECVDKTDDTVTYRWTIADTGIGMSEDFLQHIFDPFTQENSDARSVYRGTGLGMSIVKGLIDRIGGQIEVSSRKGVGSVFTITIPFEIAREMSAREENVLKTVGKDEPLPSIKGLSLLVAEDNDLNLEIVERLLTDAGANVTVARDGKQAIDLFESSPVGSFDAILMDVMMPVMDGLAATKEIRTLDRADAKTIPIVAMTANAFQEDAEQCIAAGMNAHFAKPLDIGKLIGMLRNLCDK